MNNPLEVAHRRVTAEYRQAHGLAYEQQLAEMDGYAQKVMPASVSATLPIRFSHLRAYGKSPADGHLARTQDSESTYAMERGTAVHAILFNTRKVIGYDKPRRGKKYTAFAADHPDCEILTATEFANATAMAQSVRASSLAMGVLQGVFEDTILFDWYGRKCRATPDVRGDGFVTELKTTATSHPERFPWHSLKFAYHAQLRMQQIACNEACPDAYVVAVESSGAFNVTVFKLTPEALLDGEKLLCLWMERLITCEAADHYPPYVESIVPLDVPRNDDLEYSDEPEEEPVPPLEL